MRSRRKRSRPAIELNHQAEVIIMKHCLVFLLALALFAVVLVPQKSAHSRQGEKAGARYVDNQILVKFKPGAEEAMSSVEVADFVARRHGSRAESLRESGRGGQYVIELDGSLSVEDAVRQAQSDPRVEYAEPNYL